MGEQGRQASRVTRPATALFCLWLALQGSTQAAPVVAPEGAPPARLRPTAVGGVINACDLPASVDSPAPAPTAFKVSGKCRFDLPVEIGRGKDVRITGDGAEISGVRGIFVVRRGASLELDGVVLSGSSAPAIENSGILRIENSTFHKNHGGRGSGGAIVNDGGEVTVRNATFSGNTADDGGAIANEDGHLTVRNATFVGNEASRRLGGAIFNAGSADVSGSLFLSNEALGGGALASYPGAERFTLKHSAIRDQTGSPCFEDEGFPIDGNDNLLDGPGSGCGAEPVEGLAKLVDVPGDGISTAVAPANGNPAIDAGPKECPPRDRRGFDRGPAARNPCDIGAYEANRVSIRDAVTAEGRAGCRRVGLTIVLDVTPVEDVSVEYDVPPSPHSCEPAGALARRRGRISLPPGTRSAALAVGVMAQRGFSPSRRLSVMLVDAVNAAVAPGAGKAAAVLVNDDRNTPPVAADHSATVGAGSSVTIDLADLVEDAETSDAELDYSLTAPPSLGTVSLDGSLATYSAPPGSSGPDAFGYLVEDRGDAACARPPCEPARTARGTVSIEIAPAAAPATTSEPERAVEGSAAPSPSSAGPARRPGARDPTAEPEDATATGLPSVGAGPDLTLTEVELELIRAGVAVGIAAREPDSLLVRATVANRGPGPSTPTVLTVATGDWQETVPLPAVPARDEVAVEESLTSPPEITDDTRFDVTIGLVEGEVDPSNNARADVVAAIPRDGLSPGLWTLIVVGALLVAGGLAYAIVNVLHSRGPRRARRRPRRVEADRPVAGSELGDLVDRCLGADPGPQLWAAGPACARIRDDIGDDAAAHALLATLYWRAVMETPRFGEILGDGGSGPDRRDVLVVSHALGTRLDLVVLDETFVAPEPASCFVEPTPEELASAWASLRGPLGRRFGGDVVARALGEVARVTRFGVVTAARPEIVPASCPSPAWVVTDESKQGVSTAGAVVLGPRGQKGVTVADHAVRGHEKVVVDGRLGRVVSSDAISDSSFVEVAVHGVAAPRGAKGPLTGMTPRQMEVVEFEGARSGRTQTRVVGWDPTILTTEAYIQSKVVTEPVTLPGDSGAALVDADGHVLGFAFYTTGLDAHPAHSGWIWADSVYRAHGLQPPAG